MWKTPYVMTLQSHYDDPMSASLALTTPEVQYKHFCYKVIERWIDNIQVKLCFAKSCISKKKEKQIGPKTEIGPDHSKGRERWDENPESKILAKINTDIHGPSFSL